MTMTSAMLQAFTVFFFKNGMEECTSAHTLFICSLVQTAGWFAKLKTIVEIALFDSIVIEDLFLL